MAKNTKKIDENGLNRFFPRAFIYDLGDEQ
jgi:hypothetical protein